MVPEQAQISWLDGRYDKNTVHRIHIHRIFHFQKISEPMDGFLKFWGLGGWLFFELEIWRHGGILMIEGFLPLEFHRGQLDKGAFLENAYFYGLNQFTNKAQTDNTADDCRRYKTSIQWCHWSVMFLCSFVEKKTQNMSCVNQAPEASLVHLYKTSFFLLLWQQPHNYYFVH